MLHPFAKACPDQVASLRRLQSHSSRKLFPESGVFPFCSLPLPLCQQSWKLKLGSQDQPLCSSPAVFSLSACLLPGS